MDFCVDENDPELMMALRMSMEEEKRRKDKEGKKEEKKRGKEGRKERTTKNSSWSTRRENWRR